MSKTKKILHFEDNGQDFLRWHLDKDDQVIKSCPFQGFVWNGVHVIECEENKQPTIWDKNGEVVKLIHKIKKIELID